MASGALLAAACQTTGNEMVNYNLDSAASRSNPHRVRSNLWYRVTLPDGRSGYLAEIYVAPRDRGGLGLAVC
jgi:hypothetical protein